MLRPSFSLGILTAMTLSSSVHADGGPAPDFLRAHAETRGFLLGRPASPHITPDDKTVLFLRSGPRSAEQSLFAFDVATEKTRELLSPARLLGGGTEQLSAAERARRERMRQSARGFTAFDLSEDGSLVLLTLSGHLFTLHLADGKVAALPTGDGSAASPVIDAHLSPDGKRVAYVREHDLHTLELASGKETRLTHSTDPRVENGVAEFVAQEEMSRFTGLWWSPDSRQLAYEEVDNRAVESFHVADLARPESVPESFSYPRPGKANAKVRVGVIAAVGGQATWLSWDTSRFPYLATVVWKHRGPLTLVVESREQRDLEVLAADPHSGKTERLLVEHDAAWINLDQSTPRWLVDGSAFLWSSERTGGRRLELRDRQGALVSVLPPADAEYQRLVDVDPARRQAWVLASPESTEMHLYRVPLDGGPAERMTRAPGVHGAVFGTSHQLYVETATHLGAMPRSTVHTLAAQVGELPSVAEEPPRGGHTELVHAGALEFRAAVTRPRTFQAGKKYPVIVEVYGGPHHLVAQHAMGSTLLRQWMADHGFIVVSVDGRGTPGRGRAWEREIAGSFARSTLDDQVVALQALAARHPELDLARVGIYGWSFGGYMAALGALRRPDIFQVAVAGAPVVDWRDYDTHYTERYLGLPDEKAAAYRESSLLTYAGDLRRPLLLIHGTGDDNVYFLHTLKLADALFRAGKHFELLPLAGVTHMVPDALVKQRLYTRIVETLARVLHPEP